MPLIHQRRQHIISNTPDVIVRQTILQPDIPHPPLLAKTLPVPSMIRMAPAQHVPSLTAPKLTAIVRPVAPPTPAPAPKPTLPKIQPAHIDTVPLTPATELADSPDPLPTGRSTEAGSACCPQRTAARPVPTTTRRNGR